MAGSRKSSRSSKQSRSRGSGNGRSNGSGPSRSIAVAAPEPEVETTSVVQAAPRRRFSLKRALIGIGLFALVLVLAGFGFAYWTVQKGLPTIDGTVKMSGLSAPATITRDAYGVPHIVAANVEDLYAAQGYVHAQDRLFQMFLLRAAGEGRLSEAFGSGFLETDRFLRTVGFHRAAEAELAQMDPQVRKGLEAYARGVNEFLHTHTDALPLEFNIRGLKMRDWSATDSVTFGKLQAWDLTDSWDDDLMTADLTAKVGVGKLAQLLPGYPDDAPVIVPGAGSGGYLPALQAYSKYVRPYLPNFGLSELGSNNWVVDGTKSVTGKPLLSNDPHLGVRNPSIWYEVHLSTSDGKYDATGFGFASAPGIVTGHNQNIAWGVTNTGADVQDLFLETLDPEHHPGQYKSGESWLPIQVVTETINIDGAAPVTQTVRITGHGPILSDTVTVSPTIGSTLGSSVAGKAYSLQWTGLKPGKLLEAVYGLQTASNWEQFRAALSKWTVPGQNFVYADRAGNIGYQMTGELPVRRQRGSANVPIPGGGGLYDWADTIPFDELPSSYNPPEHFIATANNRPFGPDYKYEVPGDWAYPWRISRITEMLKAKDKLGADDFKAMLMDTKSPLAKKAAPIFAGLKPQTDEEKKVVGMFQGWDGDLKADSVTAAIYEVMSQQALSQTLSDDLGQDLYIEYVGTNAGAARRSLELLLDKPDDPLWDNSATPQKEQRDDILLSSLTAALADLKSVLGDNMEEWQWGKIHTLTAAHPFGSQAALAGVFNLQPVQLGGDGTTVSVAPYPLEVPFPAFQRYPVQSHQSYRMIIDLSDWSKSQSIYATGQSGQPFSNHWGDMLGNWQRGEYNPMLYTRQDIDASKEGVLTLTP
ncbi:MAG TPA: penicillin acylase family protein [Chloroflexia bacterium]|nr:penicillin acylase family protein [Chloroflexia bacterium]